MFKNKTKSNNILISPTLCHKLQIKLIVKQSPLVRHDNKEAKTTTHAQGNKTLTHSLSLSVSYTHTHTRTHVRTHSHTHTHTHTSPHTETNAREGIKKRKQGEN